jgi:methylated-DNA-[protein]-cysteine S-methyltransferase
MDTISRSRKSIGLTKPSPLYIGHLPSSPIGPMWVAVSEVGLVMVDWDMSQAQFTHQVEQHFHSPVIVDATHTAEPLQQLANYLNGILHQFDMPLDLSAMTPFQRQVLQLTSQIPYGSTTTYKELAFRVGKPNAARAVGRVEATNPMPIIIPCHRVLGSDGSLHGYGGPGGIKLKAWLLQLERAGLKKSAGVTPAER